MLQKVLKGNGWQASCDACSEEIEFPDAETFNDALTDLKLADWKSVQVLGFWEHRCPECLESEKKGKSAGK